jgi:hypothetical protein
LLLPRQPGNLFLKPDLGRHCRAHGSRRTSAYKAVV